MAEAKSEIGRKKRGKTTEGGEDQGPKHDVNQAKRFPSLFSKGHGKREKDLSTCQNQVVVQKKRSGWNTEKIAGMEPGTGENNEDFMVAILQGDDGVLLEQQKAWEKWIGQTTILGS